MSPGFMVSSGNRAMKCFTDSAIELTWPGVPVTACASMRPSRSNTPAERSPHSRTIGLKAVRIRVCACSSTTAIRRFHMICRSIRPTLLDWLMLSSRFLAVHDDTAGGIDVRGKTGRNIGRGLVLGDDGRPREGAARRQGLAAIDRNLGGAAAAAVEHRPLADGHGLRHGGGRAPPFLEHCVMLALPGAALG